MATPDLATRLANVAGDQTAQTVDLESRIAAVAAGKSTEPTAPTLTPEQTLSRTNANMAAAMSGQPQSTPEDQANFEKGREAGTIQGGTDIAAGAVLGPVAGKVADALRPTMVAKTIGTGLVDAGGQEITRQVFEQGPSELAQQIQKLLPAKATVEQAEKIGRILYHLGAPTAAVSYLFHELFGKKNASP